jgi:ankyrin repeat protein
MSHLRFLSLLLVLLPLAALANAKDTDLIKAAERGDLQRVKELIGAKADVNATTKDGRTALMAAAFRGHADIVTLLLDKGANVEASDKFDDTALTLATGAHRTDVVRLLLDKGANIEAHSRIFRYTPLMIAALNGYADMVTLLLDKGANIEAKGALIVERENGMPGLVDTAANITPLTLAAANGKADVVKLLLDRGASTEPEKGRTGATSVALLRSTDAVMLLREAAARHSAQATSGTQPPSQPALSSTTRIAGLYQSEPKTATNSKRFYDYLRLYCDGRVLNMGLGGDGNRRDTAMIAKAFDKGVGGSGTYQIQGTAIQFSVQSPGGTVDYQGKIEGTDLRLDSFSHINGHRGHVTFHLVQPGTCEGALGTPPPGPARPAAQTSTSAQATAQAAPVQEGPTSAQPTAVATLADGKPAAPPPGTTSAPSSPALVEWEGEQQWPGLRFIISFSKGATEITNLKVRATCLEGTSSFEETRTGPGRSLPIAADGSFGSATVGSFGSVTVTGRFHADESAEGIFESGISLGCAAGATPNFKVSGKWQARPKKPVAGGATSAQPAAPAKSAEQPPSAQNNSQNPGQTRPDLGSEKKLSLCAFRFPIADAAGILPAPGLLGAISTAMDVAAANATAPYRVQLRTDFQRIYEDALKGVPSFQYTSNEKLTVKKDGKQLSLSDAVKENQLCACVRAETFLSSHSGFKKKVFVKTRWEILGSSGCKLRIDTEATSKEAYGVMPYPLDPKLKPVFLELARETAEQFSAKFPKLMKESGCPPQIQATNERVLQDKSEGTVKLATTGASMAGQPSTASPNSSATPAIANAIALPPAASNDEQKSAAPKSAARVSEASNVSREASTRGNSQGDDLITTASNGDLPRVKALLDAKADVNAKSGNGGTALMLASENGHQEVVRALLDAKADVNAKRGDGFTALIIASRDGHQEVVRALLDAGSDVNAKANYGLTALIMASQNGHQEVVQALLDAKADVYAKTSDGETALRLASKYGRRGVVQLLKSAGAAGH